VLGLGLGVEEGVGVGGGGVVCRVSLGEDQWRCYFGAVHEGFD